MDNKVKVIFKAISENESFARNVVSCFALNFNPSIALLNDIKTAVSEAVTNCIVHGYPNEVGEITLEIECIGDELHINVIDDGVGIENLEQAIEPFYTTKPDEERSGMGFTIMKSFMDDVRVESSINNGTKVYMKKKLMLDA